MSLRKSSPGRKVLAMAAVLLLIAVIAFGATACSVGVPPSSVPRMSGSIVFGQQNTGIWVSGEGKVTVTPDLAILSVGIESQDVSVTKAQQAAATAMDAVVNALKGRGIAEKDIQTTSFSIVRVTRYDQPTQQDVTIGYRVTNMVAAKIRKVADAGATIDATVLAGGDLTRINGISFTVDDPSTFLTEARKKAMADAQAKAKQLADLSGVKLGKPIYINESGGYYPPTPIYRSAMPVPAPMPAPTSISPGEQEITLNVQVVYEIQ